MLDLNDYPDIMKPRSITDYKLLLILLNFIVILGARAQTFNGETGEIPDFSGVYKRTYYPINVSGLKARMDSSFGLESVCIEITHPKVSDLKIELMSPDSTSIWLSNRNGGDEGQNYIGTCFNQQGFKGNVMEAKAPFTGVFIPDGKMSFFNNGQNPNGKWVLIIQDLAVNHTGNLNAITISFGNRPAKPHFNPCNLKDGIGCKCMNGTDSCDLLPDIIISEKMSKLLHQEYAFDDPIYPGQLRVAVGTANIGWGPLMVVGSNNWICGNDTIFGLTHCPQDTQPRQLLDQIIFRKNGNGLITYKRPAGTNYYDSKPGHDHFHADDWIIFTLRKRDIAVADALLWPIVGRSTKASYCLFDSGNCTDENQLCKDGGVIKSGDNLSNYGLGTFSSCEKNVQGISVGGIDHYGQSFEGQGLQLEKDLCNGEYYLVIEVDPHNYYLESNESNNVLVFPVTISKQRNCN